MASKQIKLRPRKHGAYNLELNQGVYDILSLFFEFKIASSTHVTRLLLQKEYQRYMYFKLTRMWQAGLLECFRPYPQALNGVPLYYFLSQKGLRALEDKGVYSRELIQRYPVSQILLREDLFEHEKEISELASMEAMIISNDLAISFKGEISSGAHGLRSEKSIEVFTPDYAAFYGYNGKQFTVYTEYERTKKSKDAMLKKIDRYLLHLDLEEQKAAILRIIFETENMEKTFWKHILYEQPELLQTLKIFTTALPLLSGSEQFREPVYATNETVDFEQGGRVVVDPSKRLKLFYFL